jgi:hypothetical protein
VVLYDKGGLGWFLLFGEELAGGLPGVQVRAVAGVEGGGVGVGDGVIIVVTSISISVSVIVDIITISNTNSSSTIPVRTEP